MWSVVIDLSKLTCCGPYKSWLFFSTHGDPNHCLYASIGFNVLTMKRSMSCKVIIWDQEWVIFQRYLNQIRKTMVFFLGWLSCMSYMTSRCWFLAACYPLTDWGRDKMAAIFQMTFSKNAFFLMEMFEFRLKFHWSLFLRVQLTIFQHWLR